MYVSLYVGKIIVTEVPLLLDFLSFPGVLHIYINECGVHLLTPGTCHDGYQHRNRLSTLCRRC